MTETFVTYARAATRRDDERRRGMLKAKIENGDLVIRLSMNEVVKLTRFSDAFKYWRQYGRPRVTNPSAWSLEILRALNERSSDKMTLVDVMFECAIDRAVERQPRGIELS